MKVSELFNEKTMNLNLVAVTKNQAIDEMINILVNGDILSDREEFKKAILKREEQSSTGIGLTIAIPHAKSKAVKSPSVAFGISKSGVDYEAIDATKAHLFFMIAVKEGENDLHLQALASLSRLLMHEDFRNKLLNAKTSKEVLELIEIQESK